MLKKINTPIRYQHLTEDPNFTSYFQFSDPGAGIPRQVEFPPGRYFFLFGGKVDGFRIQTRDGSSDWVFTDIPTSPYLHEVKFTTTGTIMARKTDKAPGDAHMVIIAPPQLADLFAGRWQHGAKQNRPRHGNCQRYRMVSAQDRQRGGATHRGSRNSRVLSREIRTHIADVRPSIRPIQHQLLHAPSRHQQQGVSHPTGLFGQRLGNHHLHRLATVGGGA